MGSYLGIVKSVAFSPDGDVLAIGAGLFHDMVQLWDVADPTHPRPLGDPVATGHTRDVDSVAFSPDETTLVSGSEDGTVRLWALP
jgi:WD40 repeat protein